jgi:hypothetical protein
MAMRYRKHSARNMYINTNMKFKVRLALNSTGFSGLRMISEPMNSPDVMATMAHRRYLPALGRFFLSSTISFTRRYTTRKTQLETAYPYITRGEFSGNMLLYPQSQEFK